MAEHKLESIPEPEQVPRKVFRSSTILCDAVEVHGGDYRQEDGKERDEIHS